MPEPDIDVVVFGATGVTGRRVAAYLAGRAPEVGRTWAAVARDPDRLAAILAEDGTQAPEVLHADVSDAASLRAMAERAKVVLNLVGPYTRHGRPVLEACIAGGAHYADLTGEIAFVREVLRDLHADAVRAEVKLVQVCGFEALPPDLAVLAAAQEARRRHGEPLDEIDLQIVLRPPPGLPRPSDALSGGTLQSMAQIAAAPDAAATTDAAALVDDPARAAEVRRRSPIRLAPRRRPDGTVIAPMTPAAFINPAVIQRTAALTEPDAPPPVYREGMGLPGGAVTLPARLALAGVLSGTQAGLGRLMHARAGLRRRVGRGMERVLPGSGYGPAADRLEDWWWRVSVEGRTAGGGAVFAEVDAEGHPGYLATARMLGEAGLLLAEPGATPPGAGCLTPATALGTDCLERFEAARLRFSVGG